MDANAALLDAAADRYPGRIAALHNETNLGQGEVVRRAIVSVCFAEPFLSRGCFGVELLLRLLAQHGIDEVNSRSRR